MIYDFACRQEELYVKYSTIPDIESILDDFILDNPLNKYFVLPDDYLDDLKPLSWGALFGISEKTDYFIRDILSDYYYAMTRYSQSSINATLRYIKEYYLERITF